MSHPLHPIHIIYDNNIIDDDVILTAVNSLILPEITSQKELSSSIRLSLISMGFYNSYIHNPVQGVDLGTSIERVLLDYRGFDEKGEGTGNPEILLLVGSTLLPEWESSVNKAVLAYRALILSYGILSKSSNCNGEELDHQLSRISPPDSASGIPHHRVIKMGDESIDSVLLDIFSKLKSRLVQRYEQVGKML
jgi:hypothetical protein